MSSILHLYKGMLQTLRQGQTIIFCVEKMYLELYKRLKGIDVDGAKVYHKYVPTPITLNNHCGQKLITVDKRCKKKKKMSKTINISLEKPTPCTKKFSCKMQMLAAYFMYVRSKDD